MLKHATVTPLDDLQIVGLVIMRMVILYRFLILEYPCPLCFLAFYPARTPLILLIHGLMAYPVLKWVC